MACDFETLKYQTETFIFVVACMTHNLPNISSLLPSTTADFPATQDLYMPCECVRVIRSVRSGFFFLCLVFFFRRIWLWQGGRAVCSISYFGIDASIHTLRWRCEEIAYFYVMNWFSHIHFFFLHSLSSVRRDVCAHKIMHFNFEIRLSMSKCVWNGSIVCGQKAK